LTGLEWYHWRRCCPSDEECWCQKKEGESRKYSCPLVCTNFKQPLYWRYVSCQKLLTVVTGLLLNITGWKLAGQHTHARTHTHIHTLYIYIYIYQGVYIYSYVHIIGCHYISVNKIKRIIDGQVVFMCLFVRHAIRNRFEQSL
jgi:hypothetical protein